MLIALMLLPWRALQLACSIREYKKYFYFLRTWTESPLVSDSLMIGPSFGVRLSGELSIVWHQYLC